MEHIKWWVLAGGIGILLFMIISRSVTTPLLWIWRGLLYSAIGAIFLYVINFVGQSFGFHIAINPLTAIIIGFLGIPGAIYLVAVKLFLLGGI